MRQKALVALFTLAVWSSQAQDTRGMISGTITDPQGANVAGAAVTVTNVETNVASSLVTNGSGYYEAPLLPAGEYRLTVEAPGFKKLVRPNLILAMSQQLKVDLQIEVGAVNESVTV